MYIYIYIYIYIYTYIYVYYVYVSTCKALRGSAYPRLCRRAKHLSAGDLLREARKSGSPQGQMIEQFMKEGKIVPVRGSGMQRERECVCVCVAYVYKVLFCALGALVRT
jgi:hypothetical protein